VLDLLAGDPGSAPELGDLLARVVTDDVVLVTYVARRLIGREQASFRSSLWVKAEAGWRLRFHQGTPIPPAALSG
jgi:ribonuclease HI